jgi:Leucine-rich repeat (LRR) protein
MMDDDETTFDFYLEMRKEMNRLIIVQLPTEIGNLGKLTKLDVSFNQLTTLPASINQITSLRLLDVFGNNDLIR